MELSCLLCIIIRIKIAQTDHVILIIIINTEMEFLKRFIRLPGCFLPNRAWLKTEVFITWYHGDCIIPNSQQKTIFIHHVYTVNINMYTLFSSIHSVNYSHLSVKIIFFFHAYILNSISSNWINESEPFCVQIMYQMHAHPVNLSCSQFHFCCVLVSVLFKSLSTAIFSANLSYSFQGISLYHQAGSLM